MIQVETCDAWRKSLALSQTTIAFQDVVVNQIQTRSVALTSTGTEPVTISSAVLTGEDFTMSGFALPLTLAPHQRALLSVQYRSSSAGTAVGQIMITSNSSTGNQAFISLSGTALTGPSAARTAGSFTYTGSPLVNTIAPANPWAPISNDFFGMTIYYLQPSSPRVTTGLTPFPSFPVSTIRLWDVAYWSFMEPSSGQFNWFKMDGIIDIAQQNGVNDFIFTFGHLPTWAALDPTNPCTNGEGPGTCSPPLMSAFDGFATQVVQRYCGKVKYYEPWNEPNNPASWSGTNAQLVTVSQHLYQIAKDPANCGCTNGICSPNGGVNPNKVLLPPIGGPSPSNIAWLNSYLAAAGSPYLYADIAAFHGYEWSGYQPEQLVTGVQLLEQSLAQYGLSNLDLWDTEGSWELDASLNQDQQASWLMRSHTAQAALGISRFVWYAYDNCTWGTLWCADNQDPTAGQSTEAGNAYATIENWFIGANLTHCQQYQNGLWACELQRAGNHDAWMLWSSTGTSIPVPVPANLGLTMYRDWQNNLISLQPELTVTQMPVLLENNDL